MKISSFLIGLLVLSLLSCEKNKEEEFNSIPGEVIIGLNGDFTSSQLFDFLSKKNLRVVNCSGFSFYSELPTDSLSFVKKQIQNLNFLNRSQVSIDPQFNQIVIRANFNDLHLKFNQKEWLNQISKLELSQMDHPYSLLVNLEIGTEKKFVQENKGETFIRYIEQNTLVRMTRQIL